MLVSFMNIFFTPMIAVALLYRIRERKVKFSAEFLVNYCVLCVSAMPFTKVMVIMVEKLTGKQVELYSSYYTVLAMIAAVIVPYAWHVFRLNVTASVEIKKNNSNEVMNDEEKAA